MSRSRSCATASGASRCSSCDRTGSRRASAARYPGRGYAVHRGGSVVTVAAFDENAAAALLRTVLARVPAGAGAEVEWLTSTQQWAIDVAVAARLELSPGGVVFLRGDVGPFRPYLPGGAYL